MIISKAKFLSFQNAFYNKVKSIPYTIKLEIVEVSKPANNEEFSMDAFVGDSPRTSKLYEFQALFEIDVPNRTREKYGLPIEVNGIVYLSPKQLVSVFGDYHLDINKTKVHFEGKTQVIDKILYIEEMYNSCIGIQIFLKDDLKGG